MDKTEPIGEPIAEEFWAKPDLEAFFNLSADYSALLGWTGLSQK